MIRPRGSQAYRLLPHETPTGTRDLESFGYLAGIKDWTIRTGVLRLIHPNLGCIQVSSLADRGGSYGVVYCTGVTFRSKRYTNFDRSRLRTVISRAEAGNRDLRL